MIGNPHRTIMIVKADVFCLVSVAVIAGDGVAIQIIAVICCLCYLPIAVIGCRDDMTAVIGRHGDGTDQYVVVVCVVDFTARSIFSFADSGKNQTVFLKAFCHRNFQSGAVVRVECLGMHLASGIERRGKGVAVGICSGCADGNVILVCSDARMPVGSGEVYFINGAIDVFGSFRIRVCFC